ncbi:hypothetical protein [Candidatus Poriferisodalis sp.]|uniref:hypothetical protein n=1 Tax=Candidatus Poriferisodalis sp. TaxID=3101277 RepID=UPI003B5154EE
MGSALLYANPEGDTLADIVNVSQYPVGSTQKAGGPVNESWADMVATARRALAADGCATLPGFLTDEGLRQARSEISSLMPKAPLRHETSSVYARSDLEVGLAPDDPRQIQMSRLIGHLTRDQIPPDAVLARVYAAPGVKQFVAACVGDFEYCPGLRSPGNENFDGLGRVLRGEAPDVVRRLRLRAGDLQIFLGRYSLHRVTKVEGQTTRCVGVLSYANRPGVIGPVDRTRSVYGRVTEAHLLAAEFAPGSGDGLIL